MDKIALCYREAEHSHTSRGRDGLLLNLVRDNVESLGLDTIEIEVDTLTRGYLEKYSLIFSMYRSRNSLQALARAQNGTPCINGPLETMKTMRKQLYSVFCELDLPRPRTLWTDLRHFIPQNYPFWLKRSDYHHIHPNDVVYIANYRDLLRAKEHFSAIGHHWVFCQDHIDGDCVKVYGVYNRVDNNLSYLDTRPAVAPDILQKIRGLILSIQKLALIEVFGGDVVVNGADVRIVDFNSWPSFATCMESGAAAIVDYGVGLLNRNGAVFVDGPKRT